jgi:hypothetical protein
MSGGGRGFDGGFDGGWDMWGAEPESAGFIGHINNALSFANDNVWPWIALGLVIAGAAAVVLIRNVKIRREFSLEE